MNCSAKLVALTRGHTQLLPEASHVKAVGNSPGSTVVSGADDTPILNNDRSYLPAQACGAAISIK